MKVCKECNINKSIDLFYGLQGECKECTKLRVKKNSDRVGTGYDFSEKGIVRVMYKTQKRNNKLRGFGVMEYTKKEFSEWLYKNNFKMIFDNWVLSGNVKDMKPSADRLDDFVGYKLSNLRLCTWLDNKEHQYRDIRNGEGTGGKRCKSLLKLNDDSCVICEYVSYSSAQRDVGHSLEYAIKKGIKCKSGFYWKYK
ncbi:MAG TPA: hypothetical protein VIC51_12890 [Psychromonas sp.]